MENRRRRTGIGERANMRDEDVYEDFQPIADWTSDSNSNVLLVDLPGFKKEMLKIAVDDTGRLTVRGQRQLSENRYKRFKQVYSLPIDSDINKISAKFEGGLLFVTIPRKENEIEEEPEEQHPVAEEIAEEHKQETSKTEEKPKEEPKEQHPLAEGIAEEHKQEASKAEERPKERELKQETTTTPEEKPKKDGKDTDVEHDKGNWVHEERTGIESKKNEGNGGLIEGRRAKEEKGLKFGFAESAIEMMAKNKGMVLAAILGLTVGIYLSHKLRSTVL